MEQVDRDRHVRPGRAEGADGLAARAMRWFAVAAVWLGWLAAYIGLEWVSFMHEYKALPITPWNPGLGAVFALLVRSTPSRGLILFAGVVLAELLVIDSALDLPEIVAVAAIIAGGYAAAAAMARRFRIDVALTRLRDVLVLLGSGICGAVVVAAILTLFLLADRQISPSDIVPATVPLLVGDIIGIAVATPLLLRFAQAGAMPELWRRALAHLPEFALYAAAIIVLLALTIGVSPTGGFNYFYLMFLPVVAAAVRHGLDGACVSLAISQLGLVGLMGRHGFDAGTFTAYQSLMLVLSATGLVVGVIVSERRQAERAVREAEARLKAKEAEAVQAARFNLVTGMASALAHEINQPMTAARALARSAQHLLSTPGSDHARASANLADLIAQIDHAGGIVRRMRSFLRRGAPRSSTLDVRTVLQDALTLARSRADGQGVTIMLDAGEDLPAIHGDHIQLQQVVLNLVHNGLDAIRETGRTDGVVTLTARWLPEQQRIEVAVRDNGGGIPADLAHRLFQPLTTSKPEGLGLGLSICASIVESHGGSIWLHSAEPGATEFRFVLPCATGQGESR